jgi:putative FmdB family regulatory protein
MALYEFHCEDCRKNFEQLTSSGDQDQGVCPACRGRNTRKLISRFAVGGQGDLRESTFHGCHDARVPLGPQCDSGPDHSGDHNHE